MERREFLKLCGAGAATIANPFRRLLPDNQPAPEGSAEDLQKYLEAILPIRSNFLPVVEANDLFAGLKNLSREQQTEDFGMYFPIYWSGQAEYGIPWHLLWIIHAHETTVSREDDPERGGQTGAMQRDPRFYSDLIAQAAAQNWRHLRLLPQRYDKSRGFLTTDFEEILFAAWKIRNDADFLSRQNPALSFEDTFLQAQYSYCSAPSARARISKYRDIKSLF